MYAKSFELDSYWVMPMHLTNHLKILCICTRLVHIQMHKCTSLITRLPSRMGTGYDSQIPSVHHSPSVGGDVPVGGVVPGQDSGRAILDGYDMFGRYRICSAGKHN